MWFRRRPRQTLLVLCSANICRSPAAEALLREQLRALGSYKSVAVLSAGTEAQVGMSPDPRMRDLASEIGVKIRGRSRPLDAALLAQATVVYAMEPEHLQSADAIMDAPEGQRRELFDPTGAPIADPYYGSKAAVREVFETLQRVARERALEWQGPGHAG